MTVLQTLLARYGGPVPWLIEYASIWQSNDEGASWSRLMPHEMQLKLSIDKLSSDATCLTTDSSRIYCTRDAAKSWELRQSPSAFSDWSSVSVHPLNSNWLIWNGRVGCGRYDVHCDRHIDAYCSRDNGLSWTLLDEYVEDCRWACDGATCSYLTAIVCETFKNKRWKTDWHNNPLELVFGDGFYDNKTKLFERIDKPLGFRDFRGNTLVISVNKVCIHITEAKAEPKLIDLVEFFKPVFLHPYPPCFSRWAEFRANSSSIG